MEIPCFPQIYLYTVLVNQMHTRRHQDIYKMKVKLQVKAPHRTALGKGGMVIFLSGYLIKVGLDQ